MVKKNKNISVSRQPGFDTWNKQGSVCHWDYSRSKAVVTIKCIAIWISQRKRRERARARENKNQNRIVSFPRRWKNTILRDKNVRGKYSIVDGSLNENLKGNFTYKKSLMHGSDVVGMEQRQTFISLSSDGENLWCFENDNKNLRQNHWMPRRAP